MLAMHDCMYSQREESKWVILAGVNDYLYPTPPATLPALLQEREGKAWMSFGRWVDPATAKVTKTEFWFPVGPVWCGPLPSARRQRLRRR